MPTAFHAAPLAGLALRCQSDARLVSLCREGHVQAFEEIVRRYRPQLVSFAGAIVPAHRAEDVVQEALTKAHSSLATSDGEMKLKPWLYRIVRNRALNDLRDEPRHQRLDEDFDGVPQPPEVAARRAELAGVVAGVKSLPAAQREALLRRELEGRSHQEIAAAIGVTPGAVRGLIFRARSALREGASVLIPLPVVRALLSAGPLTTEATGAGVGVGGAAAGLTAGGGGGIAIKAGAALLVAKLAVGSGVALQDHGDKQREATAAMVARGDGSPATRSHAESGHGAVNGSGPSGRSEADQSGRGPNSGGNSSGPGGSSGPGSGHGSSSSSSGPGATEDHSTSGHGHGGRGDHTGGGDDAGGHGGHGGSDGGHHDGGETSGHGGSGGTGEHSGSGGQGGSGTSGEGGDDSSGSGSGSSGSGSSDDGGTSTSGSESPPEH